MDVIAIPSMSEGGLNDVMSQRFGRCNSFTFVELQDNEIISVKTIQNQAMNAMGGAGIQAAETVGNNNANIVIAGFIGPNAANALNALKTKIYQAPDKQVTIKELIELYKNNKLEQITSANVASHYGMGGGRGGGRRRNF